MEGNFEVSIKNYKVHTLWTTNSISRKVSYIDIFIWTENDGEYRLRTVAQIVTAKFRNKVSID